MHEQIAPTLREVVSRMQGIRRYLEKVREPPDSPQMRVLQVAVAALAKWAYRRQTVTRTEWRKIAQVWAGILPAPRYERGEREQVAVAKRVVGEIVSQYKCYCYNICVSGARRRRRHSGRWQQKRRKRARLPLRGGSKTG